MMLWDDVRYFLAVVRKGSLSAAARVLAVEHSTVSRRVDTLERSLQVRLFDRLPRGWKITSEGEQLLNLAKCMEEEALGFERAALGVARLAGKVRVSAPPLLVSHFLLPRLKTLRSSLPSIDLELVGEMRVANLVRREADISLRIGPTTEPGLVSRTIAELKYGIYASPDAVEGSPSTWTFLGFDHNMPDFLQKQWLESFAGKRRFIMRANDLLLLFHGACEGWGVTVLPEFLAKTTDKLILVPNAPKLALCPLCLVMHPDVRHSPRVRAVADLLIDMVKTEVTSV